MKKRLRVDYNSVEEGAFEGEIILTLTTEEDDILELRFATEDAETMWDELQTVIFPEDD